MKFAPLLLLVASICTVNALEKSDPIFSDEGSFSLKASGVSSAQIIVGSDLYYMAAQDSAVLKRLAETSSSAVVSSPSPSSSPPAPLSLAATTVVSTKIVPTTVTVTTEAAGGFNLFGGPKTVTTTVVSTPLPSTVTVTVTDFVEGGTVVTAKTISVTASTAAVTNVNNFSGSTVIVSAAIVTITPAPTTITETLPAITITSRVGNITTTLAATTITHTKGLFDGLFPPPRSDESSSSQGTGKTSPTITTSRSSTLSNNGGGLFGGRTITFTEKFTTTVTVTTTEPFKLFQNSMAFPFPSGLPKPTFPPIPGIPGLPNNGGAALFPGLELPTLDLSKVHGPLDILMFVETVIKEIESKFPGNPLLGFIKLIIGELSKVETTKEMQLHLLLNIIAQFIKTIGQHPGTPIPLFPFTDSKGILNLGGNPQNPLELVIANLLKGHKN